MIKYFEIPIDITEGLTSGRILTRCRWEIVEWYHEIYPHAHFGWDGEDIIHFIPTIADPDEEAEVLGRIRERDE